MSLKKIKKNISIKLDWDAIAEKKFLENCKEPFEMDCITDDTQNSVGGPGKTRKSPRMKSCMYVCIWV